MGRSVQVRGRRTLTPAVAAAVAFLAFAALTSISFVAARGGLELPTVSARPFAAALGSNASGSGTPTSAASSTSSPTPGTSPEAAASPAPPPAPAATPTPGATGTPRPTGSPDPLLALAPCLGHPGCYVYVVRRGDTLSGISDRFDLQLWITRALNPEVGAAGTIVVGQTLYLGRDPEARLDPCPGGAACRLYVVRSGDTLSRIADRYRVAESGILALNPRLSSSSIVSGQVVRLPLFA